MNKIEKYQDSLKENEFMNTIKGDRYWTERIMKYVEETIDKYHLMNYKNNGKG